MATSGRSKSSTYPYGKRRRDNQGRKLAPRSIRSSNDNDIHYLEDCGDVLIKKATGMDPEEVKNESKHEGYSV
jgi:hypothetical protein